MRGVKRKVEGMLVVSCLLFFVSGVAVTPKAIAFTNEVQREDAFQKHFDAGVDAFRRSDLREAARQFEKAYLIKPNDPELQSWLALVGDERTKRTAMTFALEDAQPEPYDDYAALETEDHEPLWKRMFLPKHLPLGYDEASNPVTPEEGRYEVIEAGTRAGFQRLYKEGIGFQPVRGLGFSARTEIFEEPNPVDDYILEAKILKDESIDSFRAAITPLFTRSAATRIVTDYEPWPRLTYEFDYRDIFHEFEHRFAFKHRDLKTHAFNALYTIPYRIPLLGSLTINPWYKRVIAESNTDLGAFENRDEVILNLSLRPNENLEYFFQFDGYDASKQKTIGRTRLQLYKGQVRMRFPSLKLFVIPSYEYSKTDFDPSDDVFVKQDLFVDWGFDITPRLRASSKEQYVISALTDPESSPSHPMARSFGTENTLSYELFKDFDVSFGLDYAKGIGLNAFNNVGFRSALEYFKPGVLRASVGYERVSYYNIDDDLSMLSMKIFLFQ